MIVNRPIYVSILLQGMLLASNAAATPPTLDDYKDFCREYTEKHLNLGYAAEKYKAYKEDLTKEERSFKSATDYKEMAYRNCILVSEEALKAGIDPLLANAIPPSESAFRSDIAKAGNIGVMQVVPKYWCAEQGIKWISPAPFQWEPRIDKSDICKKKKLKVNFYFDGNCKPQKCSEGHCNLITCNQIRAGVLALATLKKQAETLHDALFLYNKGYSCQDPKKSAKEQQTCTANGEKYAKAVSGRYDQNKELVERIKKMKKAVTLGAAPNTKKSNKTGIDIKKIKK
jgi:hypothetical protein